MSFHDLQEGAITLLKALLKDPIEVSHRLVIMDTD
jgi:hypothetical protein